MATPLQAFVNKNYAAPIRAGVLKKLKNKGFVPPGATTPLTTAPAGGTARDRMLPRDLIGTPNVRGPFFKVTPNLNPNDYVVHTNDRGRTFYEPITEMTGLSSGQRERVRSFDAASAAQRPVIQGGYAQLQTSLNQNADATKARLSSLGSLVQASPTVVGGTPGVAGADAQLADARRQEATARSAVEVGAQSALTSVAATEGAKTLAGWDASRAGGREGLFADIRTERQAAAQGALEAKAAEQELAAQLRGQDLNLLGTQISQQGGLERALVQSGSRERVSAGELETRLLIAELNGNVSEANNIRTTLARIQAAGISASSAGRAAGTGVKAESTAEFVKTVRKNLTGAFVKNPAYDPVTAPGEPQFIRKKGSAIEPLDLVADAASQGVQIIPVLNAIRAAGPGWGRGSGDISRGIASALIDGGMDPTQAYKIARSFTGKSGDPRTAQGG